MSNETDLDWLARNMHVWPEGKCEVLVRRPRNVDTLIWSSVLSDTGWITKDQWLARRAELQNKPSWDDFGESAKFMAQDSDGAWMAFESEPAANYHVWSSMRGWCGYAREGRDRCRGEVLGDWRDTLEKRPEHLKPFTSVEGNQEQDMKQDNGWHERGELPPVGVECDIRHSCWNSEKYEKVTVAAITNEYLIVKYATFEQHYMLKDISFRPIPTERDVLIEIIKQWDGLVQTDDVLADAILAAGFKRGTA